MLSTKGIKLKLSEYEHEKNNLTVCPETNNMYVVQQKYKVYQTSKDNIYVPRSYANYHDDMKGNSIPNGIACSNLKFEGVLKQSTCQIDASDAMYKHLVESDTHNGILSLPTGYGKTTVALHVCCRLGLKTLVVVHKEFLMNQWIERIKQFIPKARIGIIQGSTIQVQNNDIVVGMLQSLCKKDYDIDIFREFGLTIIDETHHICTRTFSRFLMRYSTKHLMGLSATLQRKDGLTKVIHWFLGDVVFQIERKNQRRVVVEKHELEFELYKQPFPTNRMKQINMSEAITQVCELEMRDEYIANVLKRFHGRQILILTDRRQHCENLMTRLTSMGIECGLYIGGMKQQELANSEEKDVIIGTFSLAHEGLDIPKLDTLILASPKSDIIQSVGRILRETPGKANEPLIIDIVDKWGPFTAQFYKRTKQYKHSGFTIKQHNDNNEIMFIEDP